MDLSLVQLGLKEFVSVRRQLQSAILRRERLMVEARQILEMPPDLPGKRRNLPRPQLTAREMEVMRLIAEGCSTKEVAFRLGITFKTADAHRFHIMNKLEVHNVAGLVCFAMRAQRRTAPEPPV
jgi:DNA-binding NarL/FixJ family response regulator